MVSSKNVKVSRKSCLGTSIESFTGSAPSEQIIVSIILLHKMAVVSRLPLFRFHTRQIVASGEYFMGYEKKKPM